MTASETIAEFKAERIRKSAVIIINGAVGEVFPLFGPVREKEWAHGWEPEILYSNDPLAEEHMIFQTISQGERYLWVLSRFDTVSHLAEYTVSAKDRLWFIRVLCSEAGDRTAVTVSYTYTGFTEEANKKNIEALGEMFANNLLDWEEAINYYLRTGKQLLPNQ